MPFPKEGSFKSDLVLYQKATNDTHSRPVYQSPS